MFFRSALQGFLFTALLAIGAAGCTQKPPPPAGAAIVHSDEPEDKPTLIDVPTDGIYACYKEGFAEPLGTYTLKKDEKIGFELHQAPLERGGIKPMLLGVAGKDRFELPIAEKYVWKRL
ncbi:MAG TPA: hypothetical protein VH370_19165 [Humisphaera sp.]|jgi:hypothetical protein|nr:hypothetical protein [Humisphaera sp.]